ncbi:MAG: response regulator transcription factor [Pseudanabaena sp.]|jgi:twitching motility two-component system response regulator PilH|uniref:response regulator transcription factor n=1 Tax=Pseudanabaena mucicola TaxID=71190 RepID=UPI002578E558|nr:response regulator [Pseudanabaena mucicola]MCA6572573.1 response regulator [Pseudanabaena sp. M53BS1SP1A06MG]MCA6584407.1 response regulator [Pseudanabaena sp. M34BS1SP1A06MG]MCA6587419.1 response regulator [Pseudanabaena sp. M051S1SP1A06QC]MCA6589181.1 response regulator [Pseudanabaena sp. M109S1SP1A06QC]MCA6594476.1 response regulator [Pseudanabaena sp. M38BS1SP1A06MG]MCA6597422.1 response regulator [Pseudanabaena sp. M046S1SP1A06QC]MCA6601188.1 response regulator [Pseudanabaena sp. M57
MSTVLVVEDSVTQREMIEDLLKSIGLIVKTAGDGIEAIEQMQGSCPDIVVMDIVMPRMNGYELCRRIKTDPKTERVPVVMCSSKGEEFDRYWGRKQGADAYIAKPFQPQELVGTVKQLLRKA